MGKGGIIKTCRGHEFGECAVKCVRGDSGPKDRYQFLQEATYMKQVR